MRILFTDFDGVYNSELFYRERHRKKLFTVNYWWTQLISRTKWILNGFKYETISFANCKPHPKTKTFEYRFEHFKEEMCIERLRWTDETCKNINAKIVISSTWRYYFSIAEWNKVFLRLGLENIHVIGVTGRRDKGIRGDEVADWLAENRVSDFAIIDDDSDFPEWMLNNFFPTDTWCGLTPNTLYRIEMHFRKESEYLCGVSISKNYL